MKAVIELTPIQKFDNWFVRPLKILALLKDGDGAFIAFGTSLALYERFIRARLKGKKLKGTSENFREEATTDLGINKEDFKIWWEIFRDGINHQASPKKVEHNGIAYGWHFSHKFGAIPQKVGNEFQVNPWGFVDLVIEKYYQEPEALITTETFALGDIEFEID
jgi:hypothetical protein